ncbi:MULTISPECIES: hypothetical protein [unclassified Polaribacter]|uniref:hypothetical protein n=1 Tax=unclassified Polaribacter TaxID=196858 RepID=UPI0011BE92E9|nr:MULTISPECIES: hypothetical protein [unclassified Polaribacter]TXD53272.1 hypothetical protein ES043_04465 [Polaribacter sp. IC063]TXD60274.1 hypothetical protein ES044_08185 [Polaribacter sp. IC066]
MPLVKGIRGARSLQSGTHSITGSIYVKHSGVMLRFSKNGKTPSSNTILFSPAKTSDSDTSVVKTEGAAKSGCYISSTDILPNTASLVNNAFYYKVYDSHALKDVLEQTKNLTGRTPKSGTVDRGYKGKQWWVIQKSTYLNHH